MIGGVSHNSCQEISERERKDKSNVKVTGQRKESILSGGKEISQKW